MLAKRIRSFGYAFKGLGLAWREEFNFRFETLFAFATLILGAYFRISLTEWLFLILWFSIVLTAEVFNTALEELCDMLRTTHDPHVAKIKDLAAGAVLVASVGAAASGYLIFAPRILELLAPLS
jgi:diacylglycerol kinase